MRARPDLIEHLPRLRRYARALTGDVTRADDLVQDTVERAWWTQRRSIFIGNTDDPELYRYGAHGDEFWVNLTVAPGS